MYQAARCHYLVRVAPGINTAADGKTEEDSESRTAD